MEEINDDDILVRRIREKIESLTDDLEDARTVMPNPYGYQWLEDIDSKRSMDWVSKANARCYDTLGDPTNKTIYKDVLQIMESKEKIAYVTKHGKYYYNLWKDDKNRRGIWRRTTIESYLASHETHWEILLDIDRLCADENKSWVFKGTCYFDDGSGNFELVILKLSPGGGDAIVCREYDLVQKRFIPKDEGGFYVPKAKTQICYKSRDILLIGTDFDGSGMSLTDSGYPRVAREWCRGTELCDAKTVFEAKQGSISGSASRWYDRGTWYDMYREQTTFYTSTKRIRMDNEGYIDEVRLPESMKISTFGCTLLLELRDDWEPKQEVTNTYKAGSLLSISLQDIQNSNFKELKVLFVPTETASLSYHIGTRNYLILHILEDVKRKFQIYNWKNENGWVYRGEYIHSDISIVDDDGPPQTPGLTSVSIWADDSDFDDKIWLTSTGFTTPTRLYYTTVKTLLDRGIENVQDDCQVCHLQLVASLPQQFNSKGLRVWQHFAVSLDGTRVPYFMVGRHDLPHDNSNVTLLWGYGGFEISYTPSYSACRGKAWLEKGGVFVLANIRGGGEYGPKWHKAALKEKRHKSYEDLEAIAKDLIDRGITCKQQLGVQGGSNGGLLMGNMLTRQASRSPEDHLFGAIVCQVPLLDMKRYNKLLAGASWMGEYGNPDVAEEWAFMIKYSSYHQLRMRHFKNDAYPPMLITTSTRDDRVHPGHARKMAKRMIDSYEKILPYRSSVDKKIVYYENIEGGHGGAADSKQQARMYTIAMSFLWKTLHTAK